VLDKVCKNFGVKNFFSLISESILDVVFKDSAIKTEKLCNILKKYILSHVNTYPYTSNIRRFHIIKKENSHKNIKTLWETFLDQLLKARNDIAHGTSLFNGFSIGEVKEYRDKVYVLQFALMLVLCSYIGKNKKESGFDLRSI
jgi:hypothetical protein